MRNLFVQESSNSHTQKQESDEDILNVFRRSSNDQPFLRTRDVVSELSIGERAVQKRLNKLEEEGRVKTEKIGTAGIWWLAEDEPEEVVWEHNAKYFKYSVKAKSYSKSAIAAGILLFVVGGFLMLLGVGVQFNPSIVFPLGVRQVYMASFVAIYIGGFAFVIWGGSIVVSLLLRYVGEYLNSKV